MSRTKKRPNGVEVPFTPAEEAARDAEEAASELDIERVRVVEEVRARAVRDIGTAIPGFDTLEEIKLAVTLWPVLSSPASNPSWAQARDVYQYATTKITQAATATLAQLQAYSADSDTSWPT